MIADRHGSNTEIHLTPGKLRLLRALREAGGKLLGRDMSAVDRNLASRMHWQGVVNWEPPAQPGRANRDAWVLTLTHHGLSLLTNATHSDEDTKDVA